MWQGSGYGANADMSTAAATSSVLPSHISQNQRNDVFVGNLAFGTTEDQLYQAFSDLGRIIKVRMVTDETGKPRGFAFIEFEDPSSALSAIRNMNDYELNGRRIRVNFSNSSHLESLAGKLGMDLSSSQPPTSSTTAFSASASSTVGGGGIRLGDGTGTNSVADALKALSKAESYDIIQQLKAIADRDPDEARKLISAHPQLPEAILFLMSRLDMIQTPAATSNMLDVSTAANVMAKPSHIMNLTNPTMVVGPPASSLTTAIPPSGGIAPPGVSLGGVSNVSAARPVDPRARVDPRATAITTTARVDPRMAATARPSISNVAMAPPPLQPPATNVPPPPPMFNPYMMPPPAPAMVAPTLVPNPSSPWIVAAQVLGLDLNLVQQVMALTPQQMGQLPPDKQQSILALRQQITNAMQQQPFMQKGV